MVLGTGGCGDDSPAVPDQDAGSSMADADANAPGADAVASHDAPAEARASDTGTDGGAEEAGGDGAMDGASDASADAPAADGAPGDASIGAICDVRAYGAKGDGTTVDTRAIQAAIDACAAMGGGTVLLKGGTFFSGMISLKDSIVLDIDSTATLLGTQNVADYPDTNPPTANTQRQQARKALVYAESASNIRIEGGGTINGNGPTGSPWSGPEAGRPMAVFTVLCNHVTIQNVTIKDSACWDLVSMEDDYLTISNVTVDSRDKANRDGMDVVDCHHVAIDHANVTSGDDGICFKSGVRRGVDDVTVTNSTVQSLGANALKFGTGSYGAFTNVTFDGITVLGAKNTAMSVESVDGADVKNITFRNITFQNVGAPLFVVLGNRGSSGFGGVPMGDVPKTGSLDGVNYENIMGSNVTQTWGSWITGTPTERVKNISFTNVQIATLGGDKTVPADPPEYTNQYPEVTLFGDKPAFGYFIRHVDGVTFTGSTITAAPADARKAIESRDVTGLTMQ
jgi:polygalacturonase